MMFLLTCDKKLTKSQLSPTHASTKRKITDELKHNAGWYEVREGNPVEVQWAISDASIYQKNIDSISICRIVSYRIVSPAEISKFSLYRYRLFDISSCRIFTCGVKKS